MEKTRLPTTLSMLIAVLTLALAPAAPAAKARKDPATVTLATDLRKTTDAGSPVLATLAAGQEVMVLGMQGSQARVDWGGKVGWVPASKLHLGTGPAAASSSASGGGASFFRGLAGMLGGGASSDSGAKVPIGVRGLQQKDLASAEPDPAAVDRMETFKASSREGQTHASAAGLESHAVDYRQPAALPARSGGAIAAPRGAGN